MILRLDKMLAHCGYGSRKEVKSFIRKGEVIVNGEIIKNDDYKVDSDKDEVIVFDESVNYHELVYIMLNKPDGVVSATYDPFKETVIDLVNEYASYKVFPVGRLDIDTTGLLLITNDGLLCHKLLAPKSHVDKKYYVDVEGIVTDDDIKKFNDGVWLDGELCKPAKLEILESNNISKCHVTISEGKYHQVKRMFESVNKKVIYLKRITFGNLTLDNSLKLGEYRKLTDEEIELLRN